MSAQMKRLSNTGEETRYEVSINGRTIGVVMGKRGTQTPWGSWIEWTHNYCSDMAWGFRTRKDAVDDLLICAGEVTA